MFFSQAIWVSTALLLLHRASSSSITSHLLQIRASDADRERGVKIVSAQCFDRYYSAEKIYKAISNRKNLLDERERNHFSNEQHEFFLTREDRLPFDPPYYSLLLYVSGLHQTVYHTDSVVFTRDGKLAKVITQSTDTISDVQMQVKPYLDCTLTLKKPENPRKRKNIESPDSIRNIEKLRKSDSGKNIDGVLE